MAEALADRLAEAFAEKVHELVRREYWGYAPDEKLSVDDMLKVKYQVRLSGASWNGGVMYSLRLEFCIFERARPDLSPFSSQ